ncbi:MAG: glycogen debranching protein [Cyanobacteria bacterium J06641_5]
MGEGTIWINEQIDPAGLIQACIATQNEAMARECHQSFQNNLTPKQKAAGWQAQLRSVASWDEVPVMAQKISS